LCGDCEAHFTGLKAGLSALDVPYKINARIVRGLDYYNRTAFEIVTNQLGSQGTVLAGGRYDGLVAELGGPPTSAIGFAAGIERLGMLLAEQEGAQGQAADMPLVDVAVVALGESVLMYSMQQAAVLRMEGFSVVHCGGGGAKRQFKVADRERVRFVLVIGEDEMQSGHFTLKTMANGVQQQANMEQLIKLMS